MKYTSNTSNTYTSYIIHFNWKGHDTTEQKILENVEYINVLWKLKSYSIKVEIYNKKYIGMPQNHINWRTK